MQKAIGTRIGKRSAGALALVGIAGLAVVPALAQDDPFFMVSATLYGMHEVGHEGAGEDASGDFTAEGNMEAGTLCYYLDISGLDDVTAAHVHKGKKGENGPPVVVLETENPGGDELCADVEQELLADIKRNEKDYYVNVHTSAHPAGAIRGQLGG